MADDSQESQRREYFRLVYPTNLEPTLTIYGIPFFVMDISENGIRFRNPMRAKLPEDLFSANLQLHSGEILKVTGRIQRREWDQVALFLVRGIPYQKILAEQVFIKLAGVKR